MRNSWMIWSTAGLTAMLLLSGCPGNKSSTPRKSEGDNVVTTNIKQDDVSDLNDPPPFSFMSAVSKIASACESSCKLTQLVERDDFFSVAFDLLSQNVKVFSFRNGTGPCAIKLTGTNAGFVKAQTYNKWDPNRYAEVGNLHFTITKQGQNNEFCVPYGSVWERVDCRTQAPDQLMQLKRLDKETGETIWISTFKGWKGTLMAKKSGIIHPMACQ